MFWFTLVYRLPWSMAFIFSSLFQCALCEGHTRQEGTARALQATDQQPTYYFGHSLIYHTFTSQPDVNLLGVPYWMNQFSGWNSDGQFRANNYALPPEPQWGFDPDVSVWNGSLDMYNSVVYAELNFVQYKSPDEIYDYGDPIAATPVQSATRIIDFMNSNEKPFFIYEGWNDASITVPDFPGTTANRDAYYASNRIDSDYHQWWLELYRLVRQERPNANVILIPVAPVLVSILENILSNVRFDVLFEDNAPHGRPSVYFLAALIQYMAIVGARPSGYQPPTDGSILREITTNYGAVLDLIERELNLDPTTVTQQPTLSPTPATRSPTSRPSPGPTVNPTPRPTATPTSGPTGAPSPRPTGTPTPGPTVTPTSSRPTGTPTPGPTATPTSRPTTTPTSRPTGSPTLTPQDPIIDSCCIKPEIDASVCTTVEFCNESQFNCEGDCEGTWNIGATLVPDTPSQAPQTPSTDTCCIKPEIDASVCTTVEFCNESQFNCEGDCEGIWHTNTSAATPAPATGAPTGRPTPRPTPGPTGAPTSRPTATPTSGPTGAPPGDNSREFDDVSVSSTPASCLSILLCVLLLAENLIM